MNLSKGANTTLPTTRVSVAVTGVTDVVAFALDGTGRVASDEDFAFYNTPTILHGAITLAGPSAVVIDLAALPGRVQCVAVAVSVDAPAALADAQITTTVTGGQAHLIATATGLSTERAAVLVEIYRRGGGWKIRNISAGWDEGFAALVREHGVTVDDDGDDTTGVPVVTPTAPAVPVLSGVRMVKGEERLSLDKRATLNLRKQAVHTVLLTKGAVGQRARVILVIDKTFSMQSLYTDRTIHRVVDRMVAVATQLDDDGNLEPYLYGNSYAQLPDISVDGALDWIETYLHLRGTHGGIDYATIGGANEEIPILSQIISTVTGTDPVLVLFFTDGGFHTKVPSLKRLITESAARPIFWQFIGLGDNNFGVLRALDELPGRVVDNAGFFAVDDIDTIADKALYELLLSEFPDWLAAARRERIVT